MKKFLFLCALCCLLCGCGKQLEYSGSTTTMEVPIKETTYAVVTLPVECRLTETDGITYWKFIDGTVLYRMLNDASGSGKYDSTNGVYYSGNSTCLVLDEASLVLSTTKDNAELMRKCLGVTTVNERRITLGKKQQSSVLPSYDEEAPMEFTDAKLYMPVNSKATTFDGSSAQIYVNGLSYCESWIMLRKLEQLKPILLNYLVCNDTTITKWYESDEVFFAETSSTVVACKKLTQNQWVCYIASADMRDFVLKGIDTIHLDGGN